MAPIDIVVLAVIGIAFVAVCVRIYRKGTCADCARAAFARGIAPTRRPARRLKAWTRLPRILVAAFSNKTQAQTPREHPFAGRFSHLGVGMESKRMILGYR